MKKLFGLLSMAVFSTSCVYSGGHPGHWGGFRYWWGGAISWFLLVALVVLVIYLVVNSRSTRTGSGETPLDILKRRYATGEISKEEFERMKKDLEG
jgi:putative membrane protein